MTTSFADAQSLIATITVQTGAYDRFYTPVSYFPGLSESLSMEGLVLYEVHGNNRTPVPIRITAEPKNIHWQLGAAVKAGTTIHYELMQGGKQPQFDGPEVTVQKNDSALIVFSGSQPVLCYNYALMPPPPEADSSFVRSGFIHPAYTPAGKVLTNIHPKDHYHHFGIWNPWTDTQFEGETVDFWNLKKRSGTVRFKMFQSENAGFRALQQHVVFKKDGAEKVAMNEWWNVEVYPSAGNLFMWDFTSELSCASSSPITLNKYRYGGGFAIRGNAEWNNENSNVLTSEGKTRKNADSTHANWIKIAANSQQGTAGLLILSSPGNFRAPQPVRVWPEKDQHGQVFAMFSPTKDDSWTLMPGKEYQQCYRIITFDKDLTPEQAAAYWNDFAHPPLVSGERNVEGSAAAR